MVQFAQHAGLRSGGRRHRSAFARVRRLDLVLVLGVRTHGGNVLAGCGHHAGSGGCGRGGDDNIGARHRLHPPWRKRRRKARAAASLSQSAAALAGSRAQMRASRIGRTSSAPQPAVPPACRRQGWRRGLSARAQMPRGNGTCGCGAHIGQIAVVQQQRLHEAGPCRQHHHQAVGRGQAERRVAEETGADLDGEMVEPGT
jgi:hypothetical protein